MGVRSVLALTESRTEFWNEPRLRLGAGPAGQRRLYHDSASNGDYGASAFGNLLNLYRRALGLRAAAFFALSAIIGAFISPKFTHLVSSPVLLLLVMGTRMLLRTEIVPKVRQCRLLRCFSVGLAMSVLTGFLGGGGCLRHPACIGVLHWIRDEAGHWHIADGHRGQMLKRANRSTAICELRPVAHPFCWLQWLAYSRERRWQYSCPPPSCGGALPGACCCGTSRWSRGI